MNENLNLVEILKDCPKGTKLYSPLFGEVEFEEICNDATYPIVVKAKTNPIEGECTEGLRTFTSSGILCLSFNGECMLFPSKCQRDWGKFKVKKPKFDPKTLQPFDKVLVRNSNKYPWGCSFYSNMRGNERGMVKYATVSYAFKYCIPYNEDTKHLVGTTKDVPEFYRYWED